MRATLGNFVERWSKLVIWARLILFFIFLPIVIFGFVVFPEGRTISLIVFVVFSLFAIRDFRSLGSRPEYFPRSTTDDPSSRNPEEAIVSDLTKIWRVHVGVVGSQIVGAIIAWQFLPDSGLLGILAGVATASLAGVAIGVQWDRWHGGAWTNSASLVRYVYQGLAMTVTLAGIAVLIFKLFRKAN